MRLGIIGPTNLDATTKILGINRKKYFSKITKIAELVAKLGFEIVVTTDFGSSVEHFVKEYKKAGGKKAIGIIPFQDKHWGIKHLNLKILDKKIDCDTWLEQESKMDEESDALLCIGFSAGVVVEIAYTKYFPVEKIIVARELISKELPKEITKYAKICYAKDLLQIRKELKALLKKARRPCQ